MVSSPGAVIIATPAIKYQDKVTGSFLFQDPSWSPEEFIKTDARVLAIPRHMNRAGEGGLTRIERAAGPVEAKSLHNRIRTGDNVDLAEQFYMCREIDPVVQVGDRIIMHYIAMANFDDEIAGAFIYDGQFMMRILYRDIYATVRPTGEIIPVGGYVLLKEIPLKQKIKTKLIIPFAKEKDADYAIGQVEHISTNIGGRPPVCSGGDYVIIPKKNPWVTFDDKRYLVVHQDKISATIGQEDLQKI